MPEKVERRLAAILSADVVGYSRLMAADESGTLARLQALRREFIDPTITEHAGRIVKLMGDGALVEFTSVNEAVQCAAVIQRGMADRTAATPEDKRIELRIGVNSGDIIVEGDDIYGEGVNIAARLQELAEAGGICVSGDAYRQARGKVDVGFKNLGNVQLKNIPEPVRAYRVLLEPEAAGKVVGRRQARKHLSKRWRWAIAGIAAAVVVGVAAGVLLSLEPWTPRVEAASEENMAFPLPGKPSIAVLPFDNLSGDPDQDYFSDGITEDLITALSRFPEIFVIARNSTYTYQGRSVKVQQVAEELGVRYVLEGSVQRSGERVRVTAQFIDALTGYHLWSERYEREMADVFALQDELTQQIVAALSLKLTDAEIERARLKDTDNPEAYDLVLRSREYHCCTLVRADNDKGRALLEQAIAMDPDFARAYSFLAWTHLHDWQLGWTDDRESSLGRAFELATKAVALDEDDFMAHSALGEVYLWQRQFERATAAMERAIALNPNHPDLYRGRADILVWAGQPQEALAHVEKAARLSPKTNFSNFWVRGHAYFLLEQYEQAIADFEGAAAYNPDFWPAHLFLAASYGHVGQTEQARAAYERAVEMQPSRHMHGLSSAESKTAAPYKNPANFERIMRGLEKAGLAPAQEAPLPLPDKPSIAVLPFDNLSDDPEQEWFADGMTDDLITDLSKISGLFVIARNSSFTYKGRAVDVKTVGRELGVKYVLEGSVRRAGNNVRINAQLIDATTGGHVWAERYDGMMDVVFDLQDQVTRQVVTTLAASLTPDQQAQPEPVETESIEAYEAFRKGLQYYQNWAPDDAGKAVQWLETAIELDPEYWRAYAALARAYADADMYLWFSSVGMRGSALGPAARANELMAIVADKPRTAIHHQLLARGLVSQPVGPRARAIQEAERAAELAPNDPESYFALAWVLVFSGKWEEAIRSADRAMRLDPENPSKYRLIHGLAQFGEEKYKEAAATFEEVVSDSPQLHLVGGASLAAAYALLGREGEARAAYETFSNIWEWEAGHRLDRVNFTHRIPWRGKVATRFHESLKSLGVRAIWVQ